MRKRRMTVQTLMILRVLIDNASREMYGLEISTVAGLAPGTIHPILKRLEALGWIRSRWEDVDPAEAGRPRRRFYQLDPRGADHAQEALAEVQSIVFGFGSQPGPAVGGAAT